MATSAIVKPDLPSSVLKFVGERQLVVPPSLNDTMAIISSHNWGPLPADQEVKPYGSLAAWEADYGTEDGPGRTAVVGAFDGGGTADEGGAGAVVFVRAATAAAAAATITIQNATPAAALRIDAKWKGTTGNFIGYIRDVDPIDATKHRLRITYKGVAVETFSYVTTDVAGLADAINGRSRYVTATSLLSGVALAASAGTSLAAGNDGAVLTAAEVTAAQAALEFQDFGALSMAGLIDTAIKVQLAVWTRSQANAMRPFRLVLGGAAGETVDAAIAELIANPALRDPQVNRLGVGTWYDDLLDLNLSTAEVAPRYAGAMLARGEFSAMTRAKFGRLTPVGGTGPTNDQLRAGRDAGITMLRRISNPATKVAVSQGVTTFIDRTAAAMPYELFSEPRLVGLFNRIVRQMVVWGDDIVVGDLPVNDDTRNLVRKELRKLLDDLEAVGLAEPGSGFAIVDPPDDPSLADAIPYQFGFQPSRTANFLIGEARVI